jgi:hypothetical protein
MTGKWVSTVNDRLMLLIKAPVILGAAIMNLWDTAGRRIFLRHRSEGLFHTSDGPLRRRKLPP